MNINILEDGYEINGKKYKFPVMLTDLKEQLGNGRLYEWVSKDINDVPKTYLIYVWDDLGLAAGLKDDGLTTWRLEAAISGEDLTSQGDKGSAKDLFEGTITVLGKTIRDLSIKRDDQFGEYICGESEIYIDFREEKIREINIRTIRRRAEGKKQLSFDIQDSGLCIEDKLFTYPLDIQTMKEFVAVNPKAIGEIDEHFDNGIEIKRDYNGKDSVWIDLFYFDGKLTVNGTDYQKVKKKKDKYGFSAEGIYGDCKVYFSLSRKEGNIKFLHITRFNAGLVEKYKMKKTDEEILEFKDFNFKLTVIQQLMYEKELLFPKFDIKEFTEQYQKRDIDTYSYEPIPEVVAYFKQYPIEKRLAKEITELFQDGGDEIYMNIAPGWDGESDDFCIKSAQDAKQFPNLKKVTLITQSSTLLSNFRKIGIEAEQL